MGPGLSDYFAGAMGLGPLSALAWLSGCRNV